MKLRSPFPWHRSRSPIEWRASSTSPWGHLLISLPNISAIWPASRYRRLPPWWLTPDGVDGIAARAVLTELPAVAAFDDAEAMRQTIDDFMGLFYLFVGVMLLFGSAMAFALIFNSMSVNIAERRREVATLLAVGIGRRTISRLITAENLQVAMIGIPFGLVVGYYGSKAAMKSFESDMFAFDLYIKPVTFVIAAAAILVVALISQWPGLRAIRRLSIPEIVKERSA